jgi:GAF domain-containing protein
MKMVKQSLDGTGGSSRADEIGRRYGLMKPPELTAEIASRRWRELNRLMHACMVLRGMGLERRPFQRLLRTAGAMVGATRGIFYVRCEGESALETVASSGFVRGVPERLRSGSELAAATLGMGKPLLVSRPTESCLEEEMRWLGESSCVVFPILRQGQPWGALQLMRPEAFSEEEAVLLWMYALVVEDALPSLAEAVRAGEIPHSATSQPGLISLSVFETRLEWELECVLWGGRSSTLLRISLGHKGAGDQIKEPLRQGKVLRVVRGCLRGVDLLSPGPAGELLVFLPEIDAQEGQQVAQKIRRSLVQSRVLGEESAVIHALRIAQATCPEQGKRRDDLFRSLDSQT